MSDDGRIVFQKLGEAIGTTGPERERIRVSVTITEHERERITVEHETIQKWRRLAITGDVWRRGEREPHSGGQIEAHLTRIVNYAKGWDADWIERLRETWRDWHLNDMQAACAHQVVQWEDGPHGPRQSLDLTADCPITGYRYGTAWLVRPLPTHVEHEIDDMFGGP